MALIGSGTDGAEAGVVATEPTSVRITDNAFTPTTVSIARGRSVNWRSAANGILGEPTTNGHNVWAVKVPKRLKRKKGKFRLGLPSTEIDWTKRFTIPGRYTFICIPHKSDMRMSVVVK